MSRTKRKGSRLYNYENVKDGSRTRFDKFCENNGGCSWCLGNRQHKFLKNKLSKKELEDLIYEEY